MVRYDENGVEVDRIWFGKPGPDAYWRPAGAVWVLVVLMTAVLFAAWAVWG
jgi:hypothetical protein